MKKTAIASCYYVHNYGSMLQAYATQMALDKIGVENETIDISGFNSEIKKKKLLYFIKASLTSDILLSKFGMAKTVLKKKLSTGSYAESVRVRDKKFEEFKNNHIRFSPRYDSKQSLTESCRNNYSVVVVGSDQLWLPGNISADYFTLNFVPDEVKRVSYSTSFGQAELPKGMQEKAKAFLERIDCISVREKSGQKLISELTGREAEVVCDPTMLFTGEEWMSIQTEEPLYDQPYILCYFLGNNPCQREFVKRLKEHTGCKIVALLHLDEYIKSDEGYADITPYDVGPAEFLNLVRNAQYVCSDSFHCAVFSILYKKEFFSFRRYARNTGYSTNSRLDTLFELVQISGRILNGDENVQDVIADKIDFNKAHSLLENAREKSYEFLRRAFLK